MRQKVKKDCRLPGVCYRRAKNIAFIMKKYFLQKHLRYENVTQMFL